MKDRVSKQIILNAGNGVEFVTHKSDEAVQIDVELLKVAKNERQLTLTNRELNRILREAEKIHLNGNPNVKLNSEWMNNIRRLVNQARL